MPVNIVRNAWLAMQENSLRAAGRLAYAAKLVPRKSPHLRTGESGETAALFYLRRQGYIVTARRWTTPKFRGDIDLVAWDGDVLCFLEVKTRSIRDERYTAESAVTREKRNTLRKLAREYRAHVTRPLAGLRFDVVAVYGDPARKPEFVLWKAAFGARTESWDDFGDRW